MVKISISFKEYLKNTILKDKNINKYYLKQYPNSKYKLDDILDDILYVLKTGISWRDLKSSVKWQSVYSHFQRFTKFNIFKKMYLSFRSDYFINNKTDIQLIDSTFIMNKFGKNHIARNMFFKNKNCNKVSFITDVNGVPLSVLVKTGNIHDLHFTEPHINDLYFLNKKHNTKITLLADKAYESKNLRTSITASNYSLMIPKKSNAKTTYPFDPNLYKKRIFVEHSFQKLKIFRRIAISYDSLLKTYLSFLFLAVSQIIFKKI
jgi:transposase